MLAFHKITATFFGIGYVGKGGGTLAAIALCIIWLFVPAEILTPEGQVLVAFFVFALGVWSGNVVDKTWGKDSSKVVIDEVGGMIVTLIFLPVTVKVVLTGLFLFRLFDIVKPLFIKKLEYLPKGWGVMADDFLAGVYAHIVLMLLLNYNIV